MKRVLITGARGGVAAMLLPGLTGYELVLTDRISASEGVSEGGDLVVGDLNDPAFARDVVQGADAVVHLAANPDPDTSWDDLRAPNADVVVNVTEAAAEAGARLVLASSAHVMGQYVVRGETGIDPDLPVGPCCPYGAAKAFAEAYGRMMAYRRRVHVVALRLGATRPTPPATSALDSWLGCEDLRQLVIRALEADLDPLPAPFTACHGVSANTRSPWSPRNEIGYRPTQDAEPYAEQVPVDDGWGPCRPTA